MEPFFLFNYEAEEYDRRQREAHATVFTAQGLAALAAIWTPASFTQQDHRSATFTLPSGQPFQVSAAAISAPATLDHDWERAAVRHIESQWGGRAALGSNEAMSVESRLWARAYAEVYGIKLFDLNDYGARALKPDQLAQLPAMRAEIRARHADAPPARPDEAQQLAAMYAARFPFRVPQVA